MATIRLLFRHSSNFFRINRSLREPLLLTTSAKSWTQYGHRPVSYVSNIMRLSARKRHYLVIGLSFGSATITLLLLNDYFKNNKLKFNQKREIPAAAAQVLMASEVPQLIPSRSVSNFRIK